MFVQEYVKDKIKIGKELGKKIFFMQPKTKKIKKIE